MYMYMYIVYKMNMYIHVHVYMYESTYGLSSCLCVNRYKKSYGNVVTAHTCCNDDIIVDPVLCVSLKTLPPIPLSLPPDNSCRPTNELLDAGGGGGAAW